MIIKKEWSDISVDNIDGLITDNKELESKLLEIDCFKVLANHEHEKKHNNFDSFISLPTTVEEINEKVENEDVKKKFAINSFIKIKSYSLDKNEKKLSKGKLFVILTEKEIQLLELFLSEQKPVAKNDILSKVWHYSTDADTHTVETHIYRLRKKINEKFNDENFLLNNKEGYYLWKKEIK